MRLVASEDNCGLWTCRPDGDDLAVRGSDPFTAFLDCCRALHLETCQFVRVERDRNRVVFDSGTHCRNCGGTGRDSVDGVPDLCPVCRGAGRV